MINKIRQILLDEDYEQEDMVEHIWKLNDRECIDFHSIAKEFADNDEHGLRETFIIISTLMGGLNIGDYDVI